MHPSAVCSKTFRLSIDSFGVRHVRTRMHTDLDGTSERYPIGPLPYNLSIIHSNILFDPAPSGTMAPPAAGAADAAEHGAAASSASSAQPQEPPNSNNGTRSSTADASCSASASTSKNNPTETTTGESSSSDPSPFSSYTASAGYKGDYVSDYELLLTGEKPKAASASSSASDAKNSTATDGKPSVSQVVEGMRKTGGRPADTKLVPNLGSKMKSKDRQRHKSSKKDQAWAKKVAFQPQPSHAQGSSSRSSSSPTAKVQARISSSAEAGRIFSNASAAASATSAAIDPTAAAAASSASTPAAGTSQNMLFDHHAESILQVDAHFRRAAAAVWVVYPALIAISYRFCPPDLTQPLVGIEKNAAALAAILLFVSVVSIILPLLYRGRQRAFSGVVIGALTVQSVAFITDLLMASVAVPVMIDPVFGTRVHLLRWCEWTPLAFLMTFLTEGVGVPNVPSKRMKGGWKESLGRKKKDDDYRGDDDDNDKDDGKDEPDMSKSTHIGAAYTNGLAQGFSTLCGLIFPFCPGLKSWTFFMVVSCLLFFVIFYRLNCKIKSHRKMAMGSSVDEIEIYNRSLLSLKLLGTCTFLWTVLVCTYFFSTIGPTLFPNLEDKVDVEALTMVGECTMDVVAKVLYMFIIVDVHDQVFDQSARAERRLEELRQMMAVVWDNSSDVIGISVRSINGNVTTMLSPTYLKIYQNRKEKLTARSQDSKRYGKDGQGNALIFELDAKEFGHSEEGKEVTNVSTKASRRASYKDAQEASPTAFKEASSRILSKGATKDGSGRRVEPKIVYNIEFAASSSKKKRRSPISNNAPAGSDDDGDGQGSGRRRAYGNVTGFAAAETPDIRPEEFSSVAELVVRAWDLDATETLLMQDLVLLHQAEEHIIRCEAKVTRLEENALVIVVRDISERFRRFEAEKKVIHETTAREKDAEANRFTRHEVKNGLLAAIGLCDSLRDTLVDKNSLSNNPITSGELVSSNNMIATEKLGQLLSLRGSLATLQKMPVSSGGHNPADLATDLGRCLSELDKTLHEVLDTILAEAMARDVIHEVYEPKLEKIDIKGILCGSNLNVFKESRLERFPFLTHPNPLPQFAFDPQLLKYIHRNAISNGCKYGKKGGLVLTELHYDAKQGMFQMDVVNLPGEHHDKLVAMGDAASAAVFSPRKRLHSGFSESKSRSEFIESHSSGDGAWIMTKCAKTLGGECSIKFQSNRTVFSLRCPIVTFEDSVNKNISIHPSNFKLPDNVWGIAIDDSKIQRKLLDRFLQLAGVRKDRCIVQGKDMQEIESFDDFVIDHIEQYPDDYFVLIADENLDVADDSMSTHVTISGSMCIENIRHRLLPDQERRMLALVRSANDSSRDIAIYNSRAHGFLPKAPIKKQGVLEMLAPAWEKRFPPGGLADEDAHVSPSIPSLVEDTGTDSEDDLELQIDLAELRAEVEELHAMCSADDDVLAEKWPLIWERLHALKGDLKSLPNNGRASVAVETISSLRGSTLPNNFRGRWITIHALVKSIWA